MEKKKVGDWVKEHKVKHGGSHTKQEYVWRKNDIGRESGKI